MIYFDWAATSVPDSEIIDKVREAEKIYFGNPSSIHAEGRKAKKLLIQSREILADTLNVHPEEVIFTSGGTESNNIILFSLLARSAWKGTYKKKVIVTGIEHPSVYDPALFLQKLEYDVVIINPDQEGRIIPEKIAEAIDARTVLVTCMYVNNETGAIQPIMETGKLIRDAEKKTGRKILFHVDAVQAFGKIPFSLSSLNVDTASISGHKIGGSKGIGALYVQKDISYDFLYKGGDQEDKRRPGTENIAGAYSLALNGKKAAALLDDRLTKTRLLMKRLISSLSGIKGIVFLPQSRNKENQDLFSPYILKVAFPEIPGEVLVRMLEEKGILVSTGSACSSQKKKGKHRVLERMNVPAHIAESSIRISPGCLTTEEDVDTLLSIMARLIPELQKIM
ncbi:MAG: cysteine desulfurase [Spirochaetales bacterium]|nr:cysteine desulfurase [Spirochaetales bacterium]